MVSSDDSIIVSLKNSIVAKINALIGNHDSSNTAHTNIRNSIAGKVNASDIKDNLTSTDTDKPLSANQGKVLKGLVDGKASSSHSHTKSDISDFPTLSTVATTGSYNDLSDKPTIPTTTSQLTNNSGFLTSHQDISGKEDISNKVRTWSSSPKDTRYPSERLVKDSLDNKANYGHTHRKSNITDFSHTHTKSDITDFLNAVYPVGSIYMSVNNTSPSTLFGGTWQRLEDTFLYATSGTADTGYQATGGESTHTLSVNEMPAHNHTQNAHNHNPNANWDFLLGQTGVNWGSSGGKGSISGSGSNHYMYTSSSKSDVGQSHSTSNATPTINNTGGGREHNNMPPYMNVYMWKRTQ